MINLIKSKSVIFFTPIEFYVFYQHHVYRHHKWVQEEGKSTVRSLYLHHSRCKQQKTSYPTCLSKESKFTNKISWKSTCITKQQHHPERASCIITEYVCLGPTGLFTQEGKEFSSYWTAPTEDLSINRTQKFPPLPSPTEKHQSKTVVIEGIEKYNLQVLLQWNLLLVF